MSSLLDSLKEKITPDVIRGLTSSLGESGDSVQKGLLAGATAMLATLASKAQEPGFLSQIMNLISGFTTRGASAMGAAAGGGASTVTGTSQAGTSLLNMLFGNNISGIQSKIAEFSGMRSSSAGSILASAAPMVLGTLASRVSSQGLTASGLGNLLTSELPSLRSFLPSGFSIPGLSSVTSRASQIADEARTVGTPKWLWPVVLAVLLIGALLWFANRNTSTVNNAANTAANTASNAASQANSAAANGASSLGAFVKALISGGVDLK